MNHISISSKLSDLINNEWNIVNTNGDTEISYFIIKPEDSRVKIMYAYEHVNNVDSDGIAIVIEENILKFDKYLSKYSLTNMTIEELIFDVIENVWYENSYLVFDLIYRKDIASKIYPNFEEINNFAYTENVLQYEELNMLINNKPLVIY